MLLLFHLLEPLAHGRDPIVMTGVVVAVDPDVTGALIDKDECVELLGGDAVAVRVDAKALERTGGLCVYVGGGNHMLECKSGSGGSQGSEANQCDRRDPRHCSILPKAAGVT